MGRFVLIALLILLAIAVGLLLVAGLLGVMSYLAWVMIGDGWLIAWLVAQLALYIVAALVIAAFLHLRASDAGERVMWAPRARWLVVAFAVTIFPAWLRSKRQPALRPHC